MTQAASAEGGAAIFTYDPNGKEITVWQQGGIPEERSYFDPAIQQDGSAPGYISVSAACGGPPPSCRPVTSLAPPLPSSPA